MDTHFHHGRLPHDEEHLKSSTALRDIVISMSNGLTVPFALAAELQEKTTEEISQDKKQWVDFMMKYELGLEKPDPRRATKSALNIGLSYIVGGLVPLSPYFFVGSPLQGSEISAIVTIVCLFIFGWFKSKITSINPCSGALRVALIGAAAAGAAFGVAKLLGDNSKSFSTNDSQSFQLHSFYRCNQ